MKAAGFSPSASGTPDVSGAGTHVPWLDGLRGMAALWVLASHAQILSGLRWIPVLSWGELAVDLFMMLSGFLMTHLALARRQAEPWTQSRTWTHFWARRFFRIAPLYYVLLAAAFVLGPFLGEMRDLIAMQWPGIATSPERYLDQSWLNLALHGTFVFGALPDYAFRTALPDWSIGLEMQFYAMFPLLIWLVIRFGSIGTGTLVAVACAVLWLLLPGYLARFEMPAFLPLKLPVFVLGMWLAAGRHTGALRAALIASMLLAAAMFGAERDMPSACRIGLVLFMFYLMNDGSLPATALFASITDGVRRVMSHRVARFMGDTSFGVYLIHLLILLPVAGSLTQVPSYLQAPAVLRFAICLVGTAVPAYALAWLLHRLVEQPCIRFGAKLLHARYATQLNGADTPARNPQHAI